MSDPEKDGLPRTHRSIQSYVLGAILVILFILVCRFIAPFFTILLWSILLYILIGPIHQRIIRKLNLATPVGKVLKSLIAGIFAVLTVILIIIPLSFMASQVIRQIMELTRHARDYLIQNPDFVSRVFKYVADMANNLSSGFIRINPDDIQRRLVLFLSSGMQNIFRFSSMLAMNLGSFFVNILFMVFTLYFFYLDGAYLARLALHIIPIRKDHLSALVGKFKLITRNLFFGYFIVSLFQSVIAYIIFSIYRIQGALVFSILVMVVSFIPMFGASIVWAPLGIIRIIQGNVLGGIIFLGVSGFCISLLDNFLRPYFLKDRIKLHPLIIFFSILGGVTVLGFNGLIIGPMAVVLFLTVLDMILSEFKLDNRTYDDAASEGEEELEARSEE